ncbi:STAS domain-containing protein [Paraglaciecola marina]|uniref:STAS domain-containing protein n=1 Tax=Paraglaciecola marina TaxID=2500157 RepID=UPI00105E4E01|nr:STAS domain-containing protein [Paraglaciecola marina]
MNSFSVSESSDGHFILQGDLNRNTVTSAWKNSLSDLNAKQDKSNTVLPIVDLAGVRDVDTAGLAWLVNLLRQSKQQHIQFQLKNVPVTLINLAKISDVDNFLSVQ